MKEMKKKKGRTRKEEKLSATPFKGRTWGTRIKAFGHPSVILESFTETQPWARLGTRT